MYRPKPFVFIYAYLDLLLCEKGKYCTRRMDITTTTTTTRTSKNKQSAYRCGGNCQLLNIAALEVAFAISSSLGNLENIHNRLWSASKTHRSMHHTSITDKTAINLENTDRDMVEVLPSGFPSYITTNHRHAAHFGIGL